jgi:hypothetical protein
LIDRDRLADVSARCRAGNAASSDLEWLLEEIQRLADDNQRLAALVAEITEMVRDARRRRTMPVADDIQNALDRARSQKSGRGGAGNGEK